MFQIHHGIGQRLAAIRSSSTPYNAVTNTETWAYNTNGEVVDATHSTPANNRGYTFDGIGNRVEEVSNLFPSGRTYTPNALNQYDKITVGSTITNKIHDLDGNLTDDGQKIYTWDAENRLVMVQRQSDNAVISKYRYDYMSRRVYKETTTLAPQGTGAALYIYEGWNLCAEYSASFITTTTDATITALTRTLTWGQDLSGTMQGAGGVGGLLAIEEKLVTSPVNHKGIYYPLYDGNGNVTELVKSGGSTGTTLVAHYEYDPFGNLTTTAAQQNADSSGYDTVNPFRFSTKYFDEETGFYYYGYRYLDPVTGRWPSRDPIEERGGFNLYGFVANAPTFHYDLFGLCCCSEIAEQKNLLEARFDEAVALLRAGGVKCKGKDYWSCKSISLGILAALEPIPDCWKCSLERRKKQYGIIGWFDARDHQVVSCYAPPVGVESDCETERIVFDAWYANTDSIPFSDFDRDWPWPVEPERPMTGRNEGDLSDFRKKLIEEARMQDIEIISKNPESDPVKIPNVPMEWPNGSSGP